MTNFLKNFDNVACMITDTFIDDEYSTLILFRISKDVFEKEYEELHWKYLDDDLEWSDYYEDLHKIIREKYNADFISLGNINT